MGIASMLAGATAMSDTLMLNAARALATVNPALAVQVFTKMNLRVSSQKSSHSTRIKRPLTIALQHLSALETPPAISLTEAQQRFLRCRIDGMYDDLTAATIQFFARMEDGSAVSQVRRVAKRSRVW